METRSPPMLLKSNYLLVSDEPLLGALILKTEDRAMTIGIDREAARVLADHLLRFLESKKSQGQIDAE